jgi:hypothetical protein
MADGQPKLKREDTPTRTSRSILLILLFIIAANLFLFFGQASFSWASKHNDADGDGIPDHRDRCPSPSTCFGVDCAPAGWLSGRSTDFDSDGCADGSEDRDKDNDGITDERDLCPETPQSLNFVSSIKNDHDGDGCMDSLEDIDDDNDLIENTIDACPFTNPNEESDDEGCTPMQRRTQQTIGVNIGGLNDKDSLLFPKPAEPEEDEFQAWAQTIFNVALQVILGFILEQAMEKAPAWLQTLRGGVSSVDGADHKPSHASDHKTVGADDKQSSWTPVLGKHLFRLLFLMVFLAYLHQERCSLSRSYSWFAYGFEVVGMQCPGM